MTTRLPSGDGAYTSHDVAAQDEAWGVMFLGTPCDDLALIALDPRVSELDIGIRLCAIRALIRAMPDDSSRADALPTLPIREDAKQRRAISDVRYAAENGAWERVVCSGWGDPFLLAMLERRSLPVVVRDMLYAAFRQVDLAAPLHDMGGRHE